MRGLAMDLTPLRVSPVYRRLWLGTTASALGGQMTTFAVALQVFTLTGSSLAVGLVGLAAAVPAVTVGLLAGSVIDAVDRRRLVLITSSSLLVVSAALAVQALLGSRLLWPLYLLTVVQAALAGLDGPARRTFVPRLLPPYLVTAGAALSAFAFHLSGTVGPALAGVLVGTGGFATCYLVDVAGFVAALVGAAGLPPLRPVGDPTRPGPRAALDGLRFAARRPVVRGALLLDLDATVLGMPVALFPALNAERFGGSPTTLGLLSSALAVGGLVGTVLSGPLGRVGRPGRLAVVLVRTWGVALGAVAVPQPLATTLALIAAAGAADVLGVITREGILSRHVPDEYRGRVGVLESAVGVSGPDLGNLRAGALGTTAALAAGGGAVVVGALVVAIAVPAFRSHRPDP